MKYCVPCLVLLTILPGVVLTQEPPRPQSDNSKEAVFGILSNSLRDTDRDRQHAADLRLYEEIEIMRRILDRTLERVSSVPRNHFFLSGDRLKGAGASGVAIADIDNDGSMDIFISGVDTSKSALRALYPHALAGDDLVKNAHSGVVPFEAVEGYYLKGHGVVFTAALAAHPQEPIRHAAGPAVKPLSEWERTRKELHGEKVEARKKEQQAKQDSLAETILKLLAENGRNFTQFPDNEQVTVALTLRWGQGCTVCHKDPWAVSGMSDAGDGKNLADVTKRAGVADKNADIVRKSHLYRNNGDGTFSDVTEQIGRQQANSTNKVQLGKNADAGLQGSLGIDLDAGPQKNDTQNLTLLGDLNMKQGRYKEAYAAYLKALADLQKSANSHTETAGVQLRDAKDRTRLQGEIAAVEVASKLAQAALAANDRENALKALQQVAQLSTRIDAAAKLWHEEQVGSGAKKERKSPALVLPSKLIVSAPKRVLDLMGTGKMSFEDFKKEATVQHLDFGNVKAPASK